MDAAPVKQGDVLAGKYRVDRVLGAGGMGVVVAATHLELLEPVALKFMLPAATQSAESVERFLREARAAVRLKSAHVTRVYDVGRLENGAPYLVMEYLDGIDLDALLKRQGPLPPAIAALYAIQVCEALAEAHALGIVHRDLKPSNLFLTRKPDGSACIKVLDFGISKVVGAEGEFDMTKSETVLGSPSYMSPEQMRSSRSVDARTDIWSLGVILYKLATGKLPFRAQNITELITMVLEAAPDPPSVLRGEVGLQFDAVILRCLQRNRDERYPSVAALAAALTPIAPPGAGASVESMRRILAASPASARFVSESHPTAVAPPPSSVSRPADAQTPSANAASSPSRTADPTGNAWAESASRPRSRSSTALRLGAIGGALVLAAGLAVIVLHHPAPPPAAPGTSAEVRGAELAREASPAPSVTSPAPSVTPAAASPTLTSAPIVAPSSKASSAPLSPAPGALPVSKKPSSPAKPSRASSDADPFGSGRK